jgi:hypothetical protein
MRTSPLPFLALIACLLPAPLLFAHDVPADPSSIAAAVAASAESAISTSGSFSIIPIDTWASGDFSALADSWFGYSTPRTNQMSVSMDQTASTTYEGDLFFKKLKLKVGLNVDVDHNFIGKLNRLMGYVNYSGLTLRVQTSKLRGTADWSGAAMMPGMQARTDFDNNYTSVDLLYYKQTGGIDYFGIGYTSYSLPVQLDCLIYDTTQGEVWWAPTGAVYQPDMAFRIYSVLLGFDTLHQAFTRSGTLAAAQGFGFWAASQDRAGAGVSYINDEAKGWIEGANPGLSLWSAQQIAMLVDYDLTLGLQWVGDLGRARLGFGLGYNLGGQAVLCITPKGPVKEGYVDASPSIYLVHYGPILKGTISY